MVIAAFPVAKLGGLLLKQVSKPIATFAKERAKNHPFFRKYVCMPPAQFYNWCEVKMKMWILNLGKPVDVPKLNEAMAIELGANLLGEGIIFTIAAALLFSEYARGVRKEAAKEEAKKQEISEIQESLRELFCEGEKQRTEIRQLLRAVWDLERRLSQVRPFGPPKQPPGDEPAPIDGCLPNDNSPQDIKPPDHVLKTNAGAITRALDYLTFALPNMLLDP